VVERLRDAINAHDLEALATCFAPGYVSEFPAHPDRAIRGQTQMRRNWTELFGAMPNLTAELVRSAEDGAATKPGARNRR